MSAGPLTTPAPGEPQARVEDVQTATDSFVRRGGKALVLALHGAIRAIRLYPIENAAVQKALVELASAAQTLIARDNGLVLRAAGQVVFVNDTRLRLELDSYGAFAGVLGLWRTLGIGRLTVAPGAGTREWQTLLGLWQGVGGEEPLERLNELHDRLQRAGVRCFDLGPAMDDEEDAELREEAKAASKRVYQGSVAAARDVLLSARVGKPPNLRRLKRAVQGIVDQILSDETPILGLTTLRDFDEYTFVHSVNVAIFSVAIGKRLGLSKVQLYDLGLGAVLHDVGKTRLPRELINKAGSLSDQEWQLIVAHPWLGVLTMFHMMRETGDLPLRAMKVAHEHHRKVDGSGYPRSIRPRETGLYSRIVAVADGFDAATSRRSYQSVPHHPADVLRDMVENPSRGYDPVVVKALINTLGVYPVGTLVLLDSFELAVVHAAPASPDALSRPVVRIVSDAMGNVVHPGTLVDLAATDVSGRQTRTIIDTAEPERHGIRISDYFI
ncbi:MAG TPA: HD-GYP domain-containing protein [Gemmatimonadales bacterium]